MAVIDVTLGSQNVEISINEAREKVLISYQTSSDYVGTTATIAFEHSIDGVNWHALIDEIGSTVFPAVLNAADINAAAYSNVYFGNKMRAVFVVGDASAGTVIVNTSLKH